MDTSAVPGPRTAKNAKNAKNSTSERQESFPTLDEVFERLKVTQMNGGVPSASDTAILLDYCLMLEGRLDKEREQSQERLSEVKDIAGTEIVAIKTKFHKLRRDWITREIQFKDQVKKLELKLCEESLQGMEAVYETRRYSLLDTSKTFQRSVQELLDMKDGGGYAGHNDLISANPSTPSAQLEIGSQLLSNHPLHGPSHHLACITNDARDDRGKGIEAAGGGDNGHEAKDQQSSDEDAPQGGGSGGCALSTADDDASGHASQRQAFGADGQTGSIHIAELAGHSAQRRAAIRCRDHSATTGGPPARPHLEHLHLQLQDMIGTRNDDGAPLIDASLSSDAVSKRFSFLPGDDCLPGSGNTQETAEKLPGLAVLKRFDSLAAHVDRTIKASTDFVSVKGKAVDSGDFDPRKVDFFKDTAGWSWNNEDDVVKPHRCEFDKLQKRQEEEKLAFRLAVPKDPVTGQYIFRPSLPRNEPLGLRAEREADAPSTTSRTPGFAASCQKAWPPVRKQQVEAAQRDAPRVANQRSRKALFGSRADMTPARQDRIGPAARLNQQAPVNLR